MKKIDLMYVLFMLLIVPLLMVNTVYIIIGCGLWGFLAEKVMGGMTAIPMGMVTVNVIGIFILLALWGLSMPKKYAMRGAPDQKWWRDVRVWAVIVIGLEIIPYLFF